MATLSASADSAVFTSIPHEQGSTETDWTERRATMVGKGAPIVVDGSSTAGELVTPTAVSVGDSILVRSGVGASVVDMLVPDISSVELPLTAIADATYDGAEFAFDIGAASLEQQPGGLQINPDETRMWIAGSQIDKVEQFDLSVAGDPSSATLTASFDVSDKTSGAYCLLFSPDGEQFALSDLVGNLHVWDCAAPWDITAAPTYAGALDISAQTSRFEGLCWGDGASILYAVDGDDIFQYTVGTPGRVLTAVYSGKSFGLFETSRGIDVSPDGTRCLIASNYPDDEIIPLSFGTPFDVLTLSKDGVELDVSGIDTYPNGMQFNSDRTKFYLLGNGNNFVYRFSMSQEGSAIDLSSSDLAEAPTAACFDNLPVLKTALEADNTAASDPANLVTETVASREWDVNDDIVTKYKGVAKTGRSLVYQLEGDAGTTVKSLTYDLSKSAT